MAATRVLLNVPSVSCNHCKMAIENAVGPLAGVSSVAVDVAEKSVSVEFDDSGIAIDAIEAAVQDAGYEVAGRHVFGG